MNRTQTGVRGSPARATATTATTATTAIRQAEAQDLAALGDFFAGLSLRSRHQRFFAPITPSQALLRRLLGSTGADVLIALDGGVIVGHAMAADHGGPGGERETDIGVVVADRWQGQGLGSALVRELVRRAQARGVTSVTMDVLHANRQVLAMIKRRWPAARIDDGADCLTARARLPQPGQRPHPQRPQRQSGARHHGSARRRSADTRA